MFAIITKFLLTALFFQRCWADKVNGRYYPRYHLAPQKGWMNDPNGFSIFRDEYHLFYQYNPDSSQEPGIANWAHAKSNDLFNWKHLPIAMKPDQSYDKTGVFSGSAIIENDTMYLFYTGNVNHLGETPDHEQHQALATSTDGVNFTKYAGNPIIEGQEYQPNIRDPKVWKHGDTYYMVLGNSYNNDSLGQTLLYVSKDLISWELGSILDKSDGKLGYMWECPDFFQLDGLFVLMFSPQGVSPEGDKYKNLYQTGYIIGDFNYETLAFTPLTEFKELDHGHDFYATQSILDKSGKRIVIAWFDMWEQNYPERNDGWTGQMTIPRALSLSCDYTILQKPVKEISVARGPLLCSGKAPPGYSVVLKDKAGELRIRAPKHNDFELIIESDNATVSIRYDNINGKVTLDRGGEDGIRATTWRPRQQLFWNIFIDASSIELFCGDGEETFSSRFFPNSEVKVKLGDKVQATEFTVYAMKRTVPVPKEW